VTINAGEIHFGDRFPSVKPAAGKRASPLEYLGASAFQIVLGLSGILFLLSLWWFGTDVLARPGGFAQRFSPTAALPSLVHLLTETDLPRHVGVSLRRVVVGLAIAMVIGEPVGLAIGSSKLAEVTTAPSFQFLRMISPLSWMPVAVMVFGIGDAPIYFLLAFATVWPIMLSTAAGVRQIDPQWLLLSRSLAATRWETLTRIVLPGVLGHVLTGVRLAIGIAWIILVPCEMLGVSAGLGYFILDTRDRLAYPELMATVLLIGIIGFLLDALARSLAKRVSPGAGK
jgi:NitT/TauT family transport system permease protein